MSEIIDDKIDEFEAKILESCKMGVFPLTHLFLPGMYIRIIFMPKDTCVTSMIHNTVHPYFIIDGMVSVFSENMGEELLEKGHFGITTPHTRRVLFMHKDTKWATMHPLPFITGQENDLSDEDKAKIVEGIEDMILEPHVNPLLGGIIKNNVLSLTEYK